MFPNSEWLLLLFPLVGVIINGLFGHNLGRRLVAWIGCLAVGLSFVVALSLLWAQLQMPEEMTATTSTLFNWMTVGDFRVEVLEAGAEALGEDDERTRAKEAALRLLAVRARSEGELVDRLRRKGFTEELTAVVVSGLAEVGLVDDAAFARAWADEKMRLRPIGPRRLTSELLSKRIRRELVALVVDETFREHSELELARRAVEKKVRVSGGADAAKRRARLHSFLLRRGFSYEVASTVLKEIEGDSDA